MHQRGLGAAEPVALLLVLSCLRRIWAPLREDRETKTLAARERGVREIPMEDFLEAGTEPRHPGRSPLAETDAMSGGLAAAAEFATHRKERILAVGIDCGRAGAATAVRAEQRRNGRATVLEHQSACC